MSGKLNLGNKFNSLENSYDSLFGESMSTQSGIEEIPIDQLKPFGYYDEVRSQLHKFKEYNKEKMDRLIEDINENGVISPLIVRKRTQNEYEILAGHNRHKAAIEAKLKTLPCIVKNADDDQATIIMTTTNLNQRDELLPSEKAYGYKAQIDALKNQGKRTDLTSAQIEPKLRTTEIIGNIVGESRANIQRYVRLTKLTQSLLDMVDTNEIPLGVGENLSYLGDDSQITVASLIKENGIKLTLKTSQALKLKCANRDCSQQEIIDILSPVPIAAKPKNVKLNIGTSIYEKYFSDKKPKEAEKEIERILEEYFLSKNCE